MLRAGHEVTSVCNFEDPQQTKTNCLSALTCYSELAAAAVVAEVGGIKGFATVNVFGADKAALMRRRRRRRRRRRMMMMMRRRRRRRTRTRTRRS